MGVITSDREIFGTPPPVRSDDEKVVDGWSDEEKERRSWPSLGCGQWVRLVEWVRVNYIHADEYIRFYFFVNLLGCFINPHYFFGIRY